MSRREDRLRTGLREIQVPDAGGGEERALALVRSLEIGTGETPRMRRRRPASGRRLLQVAVALGLVVALISPAGAAVRHWVRDSVDDGQVPALPALTELPSDGSLLVDSPRGPWLVRADGSKRLLGSYSESSWSPHGLFVAATSQRELAAVDPGGAVRWSLSREGPVGDAAWSPDGNRIAYLDGAELRLVAGDGTGDAHLAAGIAPIRPGWRPRAARVLSFVRADGSVVTIRAGTGRVLFALPPGRKPTSVAWSRDGSRLLIVRDRELDAYEPDGRLAWRVAAPSGTTITAASIAPDGSRAATVLRSSSGARSSLRILGPGGGDQRLFEGLGSFGEVVYSPDGDWVLLAWRSADQWLFLNPGRPQRVVAISDIAAQFNPGATSASAFPQISGWCCPPG